MTKQISTEMSLLHADKTLLENLARTIGYRKQATAQLEGATAHFVAAYAQRVSEYAIAADALLSVVRASGAARRHEEMFETALEGDEDAVFEYFFNIREDLKDAEQA